MILVPLTTNSLYISRRTENTHKHNREQNAAHCLARRHTQQHEHGEHGISEAAVKPSIRHKSGGQRRRRQNECTRQASGHRRPERLAYRHGVRAVVAAA